MLRAIKFRLYPTPEQELHFVRSFGCCRFVWNCALNAVNETYKETGKGLNQFAIQKLIMALKEEHEWLSEPYSQCLQVVILNLSQAFSNFLEGRAQYPTFKSKHSKQSISYPQNVRVLDRVIEFPKIGAVDAVIHRQIQGTVKTVIVSMNSKGQFFASVLVDDGKEVPSHATNGQAIGVDSEPNHFAITGNGSKLANSFGLEKHGDNFWQRHLSPWQQGSYHRNTTLRRVSVESNSTLNMGDGGLRILTSGTGDYAHYQSARCGSRGRQTTTAALVSG